MKAWGKQLDSEQVRAMFACPKCGVEAGVRCVALVGRSQNHAERVTAARKATIAKRRQS